MAFLTPNFTNLAFFRGSWRQKNCLAFWLFIFNIWLFFEGSWHILSDCCFGFLNILLKSVIRLFRQCLLYFLKSYLAIHKRIKL